MTSVNFSLLKVFILIFLQNFYNGRVLGVNQIRQIFVYSDHYHTGKKVSMNISAEHCTNLDKSMMGQVTAVDSKGFCARLYAGKDCTGKSIDLKPRSPSHNNLGDWNFNDMLASARLCPDDCSVNITGPVPLKYGLNVSIYDRSNYQGATQILNIQGCTVIPRKFNYRVLSVNTTNSHTCFQLYNNVDCINSTGPVYDTIELRPGTPFHNDINHWGMLTIKAISHCSFKCHKNISRVSPSTLLQPQHENEVLLYDEPKFKGNVLQVSVEDKQCVNLDQFIGWEGVAQSIKVFKNNTSCFALYASQNCSANLSLKLNATLQNMATKNFSAVTRSILYRAIPCEGFRVDTASSSSQVSHAGFRWSTVIFTTLGLIAGVFLLLLGLAKWWYPNMSVGNMIQVFRRNQTGYFGGMRL